MKNVVIGEGRYSIVKQAIDSKTLRPLAVKIVDLSHHRDIFEREVEALKQLSVGHSGSPILRPIRLKGSSKVLRSGSVPACAPPAVQGASEGESSNPYIVTLHYTEVVDDKGYLYLEKLPGTLTDFLDEHERFSEAEGLMVFYKIAKAVKYIHKRGYTHNDIKPENIAFCSSTKLTKLFDFGLSMKIGDRTSSFKGGSPLYMAPEILNKTHDPVMSDVWALGITLYEMLTGVVPLGHCESLQELVKSLAEGSSGYPYPEDMSPAIVGLIRRMLEDDPKKRVSVDVILSEIRKILKR
uniref:Protein kinase domain-containing protein n=1 Tax=Arcella intermedia TaxID=1963864 RepID=A0A6B2LBN6_9EUKA